MMQLLRTVLVGAFALASSPAFAQDPAPAAATTAAASAPEASAPSAVESPRIPAGTVVSVELVDALSSTTSHIGDTFRIRLVEPINIGGRDVAPAGTTGAGEVIDAAPSGFGGRQGKLIISARYLEIDGRRVRIRGMQLTAAGADGANAALGVSMIPYVGLASIFMHGGEITLPAGASGTARLAADFDLSPQVAPANSEQSPTPAAVQQ